MIYKRWKIQYAQINLWPDVSESILNSLGCIKKHVHAHTIENAIQINRRKGAFEVVLISVSRKVPWLEIFKTIRGTPILFTSLTPSWHEDYVTANEFVNIMVGIGISVKATEHNITSGFKPVIEDLEIHGNTGTLILRRCFQSNSSKLKLDVPLLEIQEWATDCENVQHKLVEFMKSKTEDCAHCTKVKWDCFYYDKTF